ncbi:hypothetical protein CEY04_23070 [Achromobacter sp. HZ28]|nr:hypothetical protein CEY05_24235 [Achromobacter sp. HZ34]OWT74202.1 hypothetical protein CEY04_23070 [Achromobacter sp. HZ28]
MSDPVSRYELNSKLAVQDARLDAAMHQMLGIVTRMEQTCIDIRADNKAMEARFDARFLSIDAKFDRMDAKFDSIDSKFDSIEKKFSSLKTTMIVTGIGTALTVVFGVGSFNATLTSNMLAAFQVAASNQQHTRTSMAEPQAVRPPLASPQPAPPTDTEKIPPPEAPR